MTNPEIFKILIADDEAFSRYALKTIISRHFPDIEICGEAETGIDACRLAGELKPDLILMDIKMPGMNGIEASETILAVHPKITIIILSAYDYFNYAQKSLEIGIYSYLLKPFKEKQIAGKIQSVIDEKTKALVKATIKEPVVSEDIKKHLQGELINLLIAPWGHEKQIDKLLNFLNLPYNCDAVVITVTGSGLSSHKREWISSSLLAGLTGLSGENYDGIFCVIVLLPEAADRKTNSFNQNIQHRLDEIAKTDNCLIGSSTPVPLKQLTAAYSEALLSMQNSSEEELYPYELEDRFLHALEWEEFDEGWDFLEELCRIIVTLYKTASFQTEKLTSIFLSIKKTAIKSGIYDPRLDENFPMKAVINSPDNNKRVKFILDFYHQIEESAKTRTTDNETRKISRAFRYILENIFTDISLESAADHAGISPQHLSRQFKEKYEVNFIDYLTGHRINQAKYLLKTTDMNIKEISSKVGYSDPNYFSRVFRKTSGCSPIQYRSELCC